MQKGKQKDLLPKKALRPLSSNEEGFILVTVLLVIALLFPLVLAFNSKVQLNLLQAENFRNSVQALRMARAGVEGAAGILKTDDQTYDSPRDTWGTQFPSLSLGDGILMINIVDEDGKIPVNQVVASNGSDVNKDVDMRLRSLITRLGGNPEIVDALIDWVDVNDEVTGSAGAEEEYYKERGYHCKNGPLDSLDELLTIKGFDKELVLERKLADYLTVAPTDGKVNVNTAVPQVLYAVLGTETTALATPLNESDVEDLVHYREEHEFKSLKEIDGVVKITTAQLAAIMPLAKVNSSFFTVRSRKSVV